MNKKKKVNLIWVMVLVPIVLIVFGAIEATMIPEISRMLIAVAWRFIAIVALAFIPYFAAKLIKS